MYNTTTGIAWRRVLCIISLTSVVSIWLGWYVIYKTPWPMYLTDKFGIYHLVPDISCANCTKVSNDFMLQPSSKFCKSPGDVFLLILVISHHANKDAREAIRKSWGSVKEHEGKKVRTMFAFGVHKDKNFNTLVENEAKIFGDVLQTRVDDHYKKLTDKSISSLNWIDSKCSPKYVLKTDDDAYNNPYLLVDYLKGIREPNYIAGYCFTVWPDRRQSSKFFVPEYVYPDAYYPIYCSGPGYVISQSALHKIIKAVRKIRYVHMEDVAVTGLARIKAGLHYHQLPGMLENKHIKGCGLATRVINAHHVTPPEQTKMWSTVLNAIKSNCIIKGSNHGIIFCLLFLPSWGFIIYKMLFAKGTTFL
ncbi:unnamed protein product [Dimorphilus gyrociliatus]|uniref:Hexosyltransferase n=1 Tax=Dimorphilus gyrociliatus TaxID=2664684 RepID=A0A7I8W6E6_9ANNE|nr:unnamed protein product [Dimorphilus gyrociliatus]